MLWLVGAGRMAEAYAKVLAALDEPFLAVGRGEASAASFAQRTGVACRAGGVEAALAASPPPDTAIVATNVEALSATAIVLARAGCRRMLLEKPGGATADEIDAVAAAAGEAGSEIVLAYNRRFYASVLAAEAMIAEDGGPVSMHFEFTEAADVVAGLPTPRAVKENWLIANSTHVIDTAFLLAGEPRRFYAQSAGSLPWHSRAARFGGTGETVRGALFTYFADWDAPGRWGIEVNTVKRRLVLRPMEQLQVQRRGSFAVEAVPIDDALDREFKPGLHRQTAAFLRGALKERLMPARAQARRAREVYGPMLSAGRLVEAAP